MEFLTPTQLFVVATSVVSSLLFLHFLLKWKKQTGIDQKQKLLQPPQPSSSWPIIGHLHLLKGLPHIALGNLADRYGPIFMIKLGVEKAVVVSTSEMAKKCLAGDNDKVFLNRPKKIFVEHLAYKSALIGLSQYGEYWRQIRKIITVELLTNHRVQSLKHARTLEVRSAIEKISSVGSNKSVDMKECFNDISMNTIIRLVTGRSLKELYQGKEYNRCSKAFRDFFELAAVFVPADSFPFLRWLDIGGVEKKMKRVGKEIDDLAQRWLDEHRNRRSSNDDDEVQEKQDFMGVMLDIFKDGQEFTSEFDTDTIIKATCMAMILAATDTTSVTLTWALSLLLNNKDTLQKAQAELHSVVGKERNVEESDLKSLVYLQAVLKETLRLYPALPLSLARESIRDCIACGYHIPAGTQIFVNLYKIHRDPKVFEDPLRFVPERFLTTCKDYDVIGQNYEIMPFGSGRRVCPGISFAMQMMQVTLANLLHGFEISTPSGETVDMTEGYGLTNLKVTPLEVILTPRLPYNLYNSPAATMVVHY